MRTQDFQKAGVQMEGIADGGKGKGTGLSLECTNTDGHVLGILRHVTRCLSIVQMRTGGLGGALHQARVVLLATHTGACTTRRCGCRDVGGAGGRWEHGRLWGASGWAITTEQ